MAGWTIKDMAGWAGTTRLPSPSRSTTPYSCSFRSVAPRPLYPCARARPPTNTTVIAYAPLYIILRRESAEPARIRDRHRKLLMNNHPDAGGSTLIASKINEAKDILIKGKAGS